MNAAELMQAIFAYGADREGIQDRFGDNAALYELCFREFMEEGNFTALDAALKAADHARAFEAAHALKGLSGNLGLTPFYTAICTLVETLRAQRYDAVAAEYAAVRQERDALWAVFAGKIPAPRQQAGPTQAQPEKWTWAKWKSDFVAKLKDPENMRLPIGVICAAFVFVAFLIFSISTNYRENIVTESGEHLTEMSYQIKLYVEEQIKTDWNIAHSIADSVTNGRFGQDADIFALLQRKRDVWGVTELMLYTENGYCVYADGSTETNDIASDIIDNARRDGMYMSVVDSRIIYTIPVETDRVYNGSRIAAVSVVRDMKTFLDGMNFSSFNGAAWIYLTEQNGIVISMLSNAAATPAFNFRSVIEDMELTPLDKAGGQGLFSPAPAAFLMSDRNAKTYVISLPVTTGAMPLRLFYLAPEAVVNRGMNGFSRQLTVFSLSMVALFGVMAFFIFLFLYTSRKKLFDKALLARDRMFDLLIQNTRTAFALFTVNQEEPTYISSNAAEVIGDRYWVIARDDAGYRLKSSEGSESGTLRQANEMLRGWDGKTAFKSGYIRNGEAAAAYWFDYQLYPADENGMDFVGIAEDVTHTYEREEALRSAMDMATRANEAKSQFLSNMSHDIRTPMNAIVNMTNFALESVDDPHKLGPYLHTIRESSEHLLHLINDVLDMSRIESGRTALASTPFDLKAEMQRQADMVRPLAAAKSQTLITNFQKLETMTVCGDALKFSQIIMNLLSNAIKFTPERGAVRLSAREIPSLREELVAVRFIVEDNGIGIAEKDVAHIFDPFYRVNDSRVNVTEGTGLGLPICKSYVDAMGGTIKCESEAGEGSTFTVELFFKRAESVLHAQDAPHELGPVPFLGLHCLLVEDNPINQTIAKILLERVGFIVDIADDGRAGVQKFIKSKPGTYDVIYMDIRMPELDGYEATVKIRASGHPQALGIPVIAMTANVFAEDIEKARAVGMDGYLGKPIVSFDLIEETDKAFRKKGEKA